MINENTWEPIEDVDLTKRLPNEWAIIYGIKLIDPPIGILWNEYEWGYNFNKLKYSPNKKTKEGFPDFDSITDMELRANYINRDIFLSATIVEKNILKERYIETDWIRQKIIRI